MTPALLMLTLAVGPATPSHLRFPAAPAPRPAVLPLTAGTSGSGHARPSRPRGGAAVPCLRESPPAVVGPPFRAAAEAVETPAMEAIFLGATRAYRVRVVITLDGETWPDTVRRLFKHFDRDGDGGLNAHEVEHVFSLPGVTELGNGEFYTQAYAVPTLPELDRDGDGRVSPDELVHFYRDSFAELLQARPVPANDQNADTVTAAVLARLDRNGDGRLSEAELRQAERLLTAIDGDEDECLALAEFSAAGAPRADAVMAGAGMMGGNDQEIRSPPATPDDLVAGLGSLPGDAYSRLLKRYDGDRDGVLAAHEIPFDEGTAKALDADGDARLTLTELYALGRRPADIVVAMNQAATAAGCRATTSALPDGFTARSTEPGRVVLRRGATVLDFTAAPADTKVVRARFGNLVESLGGKGGVIPEASLSGVQNQFLRIIFDAADRDSDGRLTRAELNDYFRLQLAVASRAAVVQTTVRRPSLFQLLDDNEDGKLSVRELRTAWARLSVMEPAGSKFVTRQVLQPAAGFRLTNAAVTGFDVPAPTAAAVRRTNADDPATAAAAGPLWFRKMDRNVDGDLSPAEFLGDAADFARLDANGDGLISKAEAAAFDAKARPAKTKK